MEKKCAFILIIISFLVGCTDNNKEVPRISLVPEIVNDSIYTTMPGDMIVVNNYLVWSNPFSKENFLHVIDLKTGKEVGQMGKIGLGPEEFTTPGFSCIARENNLYVFDYNTKQEAFFSIDSLVKNRNYYIPVKNETKHNLLEETQLEEKMFFSNTRNEHPFYFKLDNNGEISYFGNYPIKKLSIHFGGNIAYDPTTGYLAYATWDFPYLALYKKEKGTFALQWERTSSVDYEKGKDGIIINNRGRGPKAVVFTKDYIVTIERDRAKDTTDEATVGRNFSKNAQTLFLYDYHSNLVKIVHIGMPIVRIAAKRDNNVVYAIVANPEFCLVKVPL